MENPKADHKNKDPVNHQSKNRANSNDKIKSGEKRKRKGKELAPFGNYRNYYGYRLGQELREEDPRLRVFKKEWFHDKDCLDIGCNSGLITIQIARNFKCRSILGIDIDNDRIQDAYWYMRKVIRMENSEKSSVSLDGDGHILKSHSSSEEADLSKVVSFRKENFVQNWSPPGKLYDTIICLSVTKWIHLNWGDDGLVILFSKIWRLLQPGGTLVLEPQPWSSYEKNRTVSETTETNCRNIMFYPNTLQELLLDKIGFRRVEDLSLNLSDEPNRKKRTTTTTSATADKTTDTNCRNIMFYPNTLQELLLDKIGFRRVEDLSLNLSGSKVGFNRPILAFTK